MSLLTSINVAAVGEMLIAVKQASAFGTVSCFLAGRPGSRILLVSVQGLQVQYESQVQVRVEGDAFTVRLDCGRLLAILKHCDSASGLQIAIRGNALKTVDFYNGDNYQIHLKAMVTPPFRLEKR